jgi:hypothetical protein
LIPSEVSAWHRWVISVTCMRPVYLNLSAVLPCYPQQITIWKNTALLITYWTVLYKIFLPVLYFILLIFFWCLTNFFQRIFHTTWRNGNTYIHSMHPKVSHRDSRIWNKSYIHKYTQFLQCKILQTFYKILYISHLHAQKIHLQRKIVLSCQSWGLSD